MASSLFLLHAYNRNHMHTLHIVHKYGAACSIYSSYEILHAINVNEMQKNMFSFSIGK